MEVKVEKLDNLGQGIAHINNKICFIKGALPNEIADINIMQEKKNYQKAEVNKFIKKSDKRIENKCPYHKLCGGCNLGHLDYEESLNYKKDKIKNIIYQNTNVLMEPIIIKNNQTHNYRNKITLKIKNNEWGYYNVESHNFVKINNCLLATHEINQVINNQDLFNIKNGEIVIRSNNLKEILISIKTKDKYYIDVDKLVDLNIIGLVINDKIILGKSYFNHKINNISYKISYNSFFQVNDYICSKIFDILNEQNLGNVILDLYCGVGSLGLAVSDKVKEIYGIEIIPNAILNAKENALNNHVKNATYYVGKVEDNLKLINKKIDTIIVDPPRKGLSDIESIININANHIIYISCDPVTLGRDLKELVKYYNVDKVYALDMFPNTYHVECVCILKIL